jgi:CheY-like chemotaxis protein
MPRFDGFMLAREIRRSETTSKTVIIVLTSGAQEDDAQLCQELGIAARLLKPIKQSELLDAIVDAVAPTVQSREETRGEVEDVVQPLNILLAEDGLANQKLAIGLLTRWGHSVTVANNGREAVDLWQQQHFDLILMDIQMPELDGIEATRMIRQQEEPKGIHIPIVAMTAHALKGDREKCLAAGMDGYISKPVRKQDLLDALKDLSG